MLCIETNEDVYEPAEDSFLLAKHAKKLKGRILEVGCGCGFVSLECAVSHPSNIIEGVDINLAAIVLARKNAKNNHIKNAKFYVSNLFSNVIGKYDYILFNPPYLPTIEGDRIAGRLNLAFDGGIDGLVVVREFAGKAAKYLKKAGSVYMIASSLAGIGKIKKLFNKNGFKVDVIEEESFFFEKIALLKAIKR